MNSQKFSLAGVITASLLAIASISHAAPFQNGGFDTPYTGPQEDNLVNGDTSLTGWTVLAAGASTVGLYSSPSFNISSQAGGYYLDLTGTGDTPSGVSTNLGYVPYQDTNGNDTFAGVDQAFSTTVGTNYTVQFYIGDSTNYAEAGAGIDAFITTSAPASFSSLVGMTPTDSVVAPTATGVTTWTAESFNFTATSTSTTLSLLGFEVGTGLQYIGLDSVSVMSNAAPGVPDSGSTFLLLAIGLGGLAFRKQFQAHAA